MARILIWTLQGLSVAWVAALLAGCSPKSEDQFMRLMTQGNGYLQKGDSAAAINAYISAAKLSPNSTDAKLNLANVYLQAHDSSNAVDQCRRVIQLEPNSAAAYYLMGCAYARSNQTEDALKAFLESQRIDFKVTALNFQLGLAHARLGHTDEAIREFETVVKFEPEHRSAYYQLNRLYAAAGRDADAAAALAKHQQILAARPLASNDPAIFEKCKYTEPLAPFKLAQPETKGVTVRFVDATAAAFDNASAYRGPMAVIDYNHDSRSSLFVGEGSGFRLLDNQAGRFKPMGELLPAATNGNWRRVLVGDLDNDGHDDVVVVGRNGTAVFRFGGEGQSQDVTAICGLKDAAGSDGLLADLDFTGKLDLLVAAPDGMRVYQNRGSFFFKENTAESGLPVQLNGATQVAMEDWQNTDQPGVFVARVGQAQAYFAKQRAGAFVATNLVQRLPPGSVLATADLDNDMRPDLIVAGESEVRIVFNGDRESVALPLRGLKAEGLLTIDYDNDGWLDLVAYGNGLRVWRNVGNAGFVDVTSSMGLDKVGQVDGLVAADFDNDGDTDLVGSTPTGLKFWRNDGGNANKQVKLKLTGTRSNAGGLGARAEVISGNWRTIRTLWQSPLEIGVGRQSRLDTVKIRWFDTETTLVDVPVQSTALACTELIVPTGSCPYLYAWDGQKFRFVTDMLGASPLGLPLNKSRYIEADAEEYLALGDEKHFPPRNGAFEVRVTEELREMLYLDTAKLVAVDHAEGTRVCTTGKLRPGAPFPPHELWTLRPVATIKSAMRSDGLDVTRELSLADGKMVSPVKLREPQLRGLAEPYSVAMDFGELPVERPLVLLLTGWLRFGGGMANVAASLDEKLPFPFPVLEAESPDGSWSKVDADAGAPAGKIKTILVDLAGKLPKGTRRLRLTTAFEIHWDEAAIYEHEKVAKARRSTISPKQTDLHWRGFSEFQDLPASLPLTPDYGRVLGTPPWRNAVSGWCTRYGPVDSLLSEKDDALVLLNAGDELELSFDAGQLPPVPPGWVRDFFLYCVGWDKDADFHVGQGWSVEPLPFHGMRDQEYGRQARPPGLDDSWIRRYNTRWVGPMVLPGNRQSE
jgi:Flp pilus assembly protein TadD